MLDAMPRRLPAALAAVGLLAGCAAPISSPIIGRDGFAFTNATPKAPLAIPAREFRPDGAGPFPAVVLMHGCHGVVPSTQRWAEWLRVRGYVALIVDSWSPRGIRDGCVPAKSEIPNSARFDDAVGALSWLHARPYVDAMRVGIMGWSNGGVFAIAAINGPSLERALARGVTMPAPGYAAAVAFYPGGCYSLVREQVVRPLLLLIGDADDWTDPWECAAMVAAMRLHGSDATIVLYHGAYHYFDDRDQPRRVLAEVENRNKPSHCCGATVGYDAVADADARRRVERFLAGHLGR